MMFPPYALFIAIATAQSLPPELVGTWTTKSGKVLTGSGFYDPVQDRVIEPSLTGISYSFTADGHYEEAYYRAIANPSDPNCAASIMQWQHGLASQNASFPLILEPIAVDGRQALSDPCSSDTSSFTRYEQAEVFQEFRVYMDPYNKKLRLDLFHWDGSPANPMWLARSSPEMLPSTTLHPQQSTTVGATSGSASPVGVSNGGATMRRKRALEDLARHSVREKNQRHYLRQARPSRPFEGVRSQVLLSLQECGYLPEMIGLAILLLATGIYIRSWATEQPTELRSSHTKVGLPVTS